MVCTFRILLLLPPRPSLPKHIFSLPSSLKWSLQHRLFETPSLELPVACTACHFLKFSVFSTYKSDSRRFRPPIYPPKTIPPRRQTPAKARVRPVAHVFLSVYNIFNILIPFVSCTVSGEMEVGTVDPSNNWNLPQLTVGCKLTRCLTAILKHKNAVGSSAIGSSKF